MVSVGYEGTYTSKWLITDDLGRFETVECDVILDAQHVEIRDDYPDSDRDDRRDGALIHELGHCLGIDHPAISPTVLGTLPWSKSSVWSEDPRMSYGVHRGKALLPDDLTAALLVRPLPGSLEATGSISGALTLDGAPAPFVVVDVLRSDGRRARPAASVFSNRRGEFLAEGLPPGEYFLWIHPLKNAPANPDLAERAPAGIDDLVALQPIPVRAGEVSRGHDFALRRGRDIRLNGVARTVLALGLGAGAACGGAGDGAAPAPVSVVPPTPPASPPPSPLEPVEVLPGVVVLAGAVETLRDPGWFRTTLDLRVSADAGNRCLRLVRPPTTPAGTRRRPSGRTSWSGASNGRMTARRCIPSTSSGPRTKRWVCAFGPTPTPAGDQPALLCTAAACTLTP